ncbi:MAG: tetratricopeptide repeat protein, partial [Methylobacterium sp.]
MTSDSVRLQRALLGLAALASVGLAGCETVGSAAGSRQFAVLEADTTGATNVNIASLTEVVQRNPNDAAAYNTRGAAYARAGQFNDAIGDFTKAVQIDPNSGSAYNNRALAYRQT